MLDLEFCVLLGADSSIKARENINFSLGWPIGVENVLMLLGRIFLSANKALKTLQTTRKTNAFISGGIFGWLGLEQCNQKTTPLVHSASQLLPSTVQLRVELSGKRLPTFRVPVFTTNGSGFIIDDQCTILTAAHVVADMLEGGHLRLIFHDGTSYWGEVVGLDLRSDLALVRPLVPSQQSSSDYNNKICRPAIPLNEPKDGFLQVGEEIATIGNPFGLRGSLAASVLSAHSWTGDLLQGLIPEAPLDSRLSYCQADLPVHPGNSGGPLFRTRDGRVIGMVDGRLSNAEGLPSCGLTLGIQLDSSALSLIEELKEKGQIFRPYLGVKGISLTSELFLQVKDDRRRALLNRCLAKLGYPSQGGGGVLVTKVHDNSPGSEAGIRPGDLIVQVEGTSIRCVGDILNRATLHRREPLKLLIVNVESSNDQVIFRETTLRTDEFDILPAHH